MRESAYTHTQTHRAETSYYKGPRVTHVYLYCYRGRRTAGAERIYIVRRELICIWRDIGHHASQLMKARQRYIINGSRRRRWSAHCNCVAKLCTLCVPPPLLTFPQCSSLCTIFLLLLLLSSLSLYLSLSFSHSPSISLFLFARSLSLSLYFTRALVLSSATINEPAYARQRHFKK